MTLHGTTSRIFLLALLLMSAAPFTAHADGPDYGVPRYWLLPWACGEEHLVTWDWDDHWANGRVRGLAIDFRLATGTPVLAPAAGMAYFRTDTSARASNLGNYVDLYIGECWLIRLAHLRDAQSGSRKVLAGEQIGISGSSGASAPHLHLEILVKRFNAWWDRPDLSQITDLFGHSLDDLREGNWVANDTCPGAPALGGDPIVEPQTVPLGEPVIIAVPIRNTAWTPLAFEAVQITATGPAGQEIRGETRGIWRLDGTAQVAVRVALWPSQAGTWQLGRVACISGAQRYELPSGGTFEVLDSPLQVVGLGIPPTAKTGQNLSITVKVQNTGYQDILADDLEIRGIQPDGKPFIARLWGPAWINAGATSQFTLTSELVAAAIGTWRLMEIGYIKEGHLFTLGQVQGQTVVSGASPSVEELRASSSPGRITVILRLKNDGSEPFTPDSIEVWGWKPDGVESFHTQTAGAIVVPPERTVVITLGIETNDVAGNWQIAEVGYWLGGAFYSLEVDVLPEVWVR